MSICICADQWKERFPNLPWPTQSLLEEWGMVTENGNLDPRLGNEVPIQYDENREAFSIDDGETWYFYKTGKVEKKKPWEKEPDEWVEKETAVGTIWMRKEVAERDPAYIANQMRVFFNEHFQFNVPLTNEEYHTMNVLIQELQDAIQETNGKSPF